MPSHAMSIDNLCISDVQEVQDDYSADYSGDYSGEYSSEYSGYSHPNWATPEDWDAHQETIRRLYLDEKRPLKDVVVIMETHYGFRATGGDEDEVEREWNEGGRWNVSHATILECFVHSTESPPPCLMLP
ncbi:hypothetical protein GGS20DRAFT_593566 [Poronia punctata]|nr:hypothetical protein GGS20DRAFT_593566 [Poronia punctata]